VCGDTVIILSGQDLFGDEGKNKKFLFLINKNGIELPPSILVTKNPN
jgi:hypothetical protein